jgi:hypothetical protein
MLCMCCLSPACQECAYNIVFYRSRGSFHVVTFKGKSVQRFEIGGHWPLATYTCMHKAVIVLFIFGMLFCVLPTYCTSGVGPPKRITTAILLASNCSTLPHSLQSLDIGRAYAQHTAAHRCPFISLFPDKHLAASAKL